MSHKQNLESRIRDCENKLQRINNGEYKLRCPDNVKTLLGYIILDCETKLFNLSLQ